MFTAAAAVLALALEPAAALAKKPVKPAAAPAAAAHPAGAAWPKGEYRKLDALPDWGGVWTLMFYMPAPPAPGQPVRPQPPRPRPQLKGKYLDEYQAYRKATQDNGGTPPREASYCQPPGMPGIMGVGQYPIEFVFSPGRVTMLMEAWGQWRRIYTDGRPHPDDPEPSFQGDSIGHWEGDALVVDTVAIKDAAKLSLGMGHSDKLHITERFQLDPKNKDILNDTVTLDDPDALAAPFTQTFNYKRSRDGTLLEFVCAENDRNPVDSQGHTEFEGIQK
jgi:hypothetical protein